MTSDTPSGQSDDVLVVVDDKPLPTGDKPEPGTDAQNPAKKETPAPGADDKKPEAAQQESPEQAAERKQTRRQRAYQRERDQRITAETELRLTREKLATLESQGKQQQDQPPKREDYPDYETYLDARQDWRATQGSNKPDAVAPKGEPSQETRTEAGPHQRIAEAWTKREEAFQKDAKDYTDVVTPFVEEDLVDLAGNARQYIVESEAGPALLYHLSKNPAEADRIAKLPAHRQAIELGRLEDKLAEPVPTKKTTGAPPPPSPIPGGKTTGTGGFHENMSDADYRQLRKAQGARWAR